MKTIKTVKFDPLGKDVAENVIISITETLPKFTDLGIAKSFYQVESEKLCRALYSTLPQALLERLTVELMKEHLSLHRGKGGKNV